RPAAARARADLAAVLLLSVLALAACKKRPQEAARPTLGPVTVRDLTPPDDAPAHVDTQALARAMRARLLATGQFSTDSADAGPEGAAITRADVQIGVDGAEVDAKGLARAQVLIRLATRPEGAPSAISESLEGAGEQRYDVPPPPKTGRAPREPLYEGLV